MSEAADKDFPSLSIGQLIDVDEVRPHVSAWARRFAAADGRANTQPCSRGRGGANKAWGVEMLAEH